MNNYNDKQLAAMYEEYCEAKRDINEKPISYEDWLYLEEQAQLEAEKTMKRCEN